MLPPDLVKLGPIAIHWYGLALAAAFLLCMNLAIRRARVYDVPEELISSIAFWGLVCGIIGARIGYILTHTYEFSISQPWEWIAIWHGGQTFFGGLAGGLAGGSYAIVRAGAQWRATMDLIAPFVPLGHAVGRIGCFMRGCCYGKVCHLPWAVRFPRHIDANGYIIGPDAYLDHLSKGLITSDAKWSLPVHPTQLYSMVVLTALYFFLSWLYKRRSFDGEVFSVYLVLYGIWRFTVEFIRIEPRIAFGLTAWQWLSLVLIVTGVTLAIVFRRYATTETDHSEKRSNGDTNKPTD